MNVFSEGRESERESVVDAVLTAGSIGSIEPGIVAVGLAWLIVSRGEQTMYRSQLISRASHDPGITGPTGPTGRETKVPF